MPPFPRAFHGDVGARAAIVGFAISTIVYNLTGKSFDIEA